MRTLAIIRQRAELVGTREFHERSLSHQCTLKRYQNKLFWSKKDAGARDVYEVVCTKKELSLYVSQEHRMTLGQIIDVVDQYASDVGIKDESVMQRAVDVASCDMYTCIKSLYKSTWKEYAFKKGKKYSILGVEVNKNERYPSVIVYVSSENGCAVSFQLLSHDGRDNRDMNALSDYFTRAPAKDRTKQIEVKVV